MAESKTHQNLVRALMDWVKNENRPDNISIFVDLPETNKNTIPKKLNGYRPDLYGTRGSDKRIYIGEAKTRGDLETRHSIKQLEAFIQYLKNHKNSILVLAVPWDMVNSAKIIVKRIRYETNADHVEYEVIKYLPG